MHASDLVPLGRTNLRITRLGLGTAGIGNLFEAVTDEEAQQVIERAYSSGIRFFDTAPLYGFGVAERRLGSALRDKPRDEYVLATKAGRILRAASGPDPSQFYEGEALYKSTPAVAPVFDFSYDGVMRSVDDSLVRLGLDRVDVAHLHDPDDYYDEAITSGFRALSELRSQGVISAVGAGMNQAEMLVRFAREADFDCFLLAGRYTLLDDSGLNELLPLAEEMGIAIIVGGVFNSGILADPRPGARFNYIPASHDLVERAVRMAAVCANHAVSLKAAALHFPFGHPAVASVLLGCRSVAELDENLAAFATEIPRDLWRELKAERLLPENVPTS